MKPTVKMVEVAIVGGGIVGLSLACRLAEQGWHIALIETRVPSKNFSADYDLPVSAITPTSKELLSAIGIWSTMASQRCGVFRKMQVWDAQGGGKIEFDSANTAMPALGYVIENSLLQTKLYQRLMNYETAAIFCPANLKDIKLNPDYAKIELEDGRRLLARLVVGADGMRSKVRELAQIAVETQDYAHTAIVANVSTELSHQETAWQCFLATGPLAFLPLADAHTSSIVWSISPMAAQRLLTLDKKDFCHELTNAFSHRLGTVTDCSDRVSFILQMQHARHYIAPPVVLVGDAAHTLHPLAGQGINLGLQDVQCLTQTLFQAKQRQRDINSLATLRRYERTRKSINTAMITLVGGVKNLFMSENYGLYCARNFGLNVLDKCVPIKSYFINKASNSSILL